MINNLFILVALLRLSCRRLRPERIPARRGLRPFASFGGYQRDQDADYVRVRTGGDRDQAVLVTVLRDLFGFFGRWSFCFLRLHQFDRLHAAEAADVADDRPAALPFAGAALEAVAEFVGAGEQIFFFE